MRRSQARFRPVFFLFLSPMLCSGLTGKRSVRSPAPPYRLVPVTVSCNGANSLASHLPLHKGHAAHNVVPRRKLLGPHASDVGNRLSLLSVLPDYFLLLHTSMPNNHLSQYPI